MKIPAKFDIKTLSPETRLRLFQRSAVGVCLLWSSVVGWGLWSTHAALAVARETLHSEKEQVHMAETSLQQEQETLAQAQELHLTSPNGSGSIEFTEEMSRIVTDSGATLTSLQYRPVEAVKVPAPKPGDKAGDKPAENEQKTADAKTGEAGKTRSKTETMAQSNIECTISGSFPALAGVWDRLVKMPRILEFHSMSLSRSGNPGAEGTVKLEMRLMGTLYGKPDKP